MLSTSADTTGSRSLRLPAAVRAEFGRRYRQEMNAVAGSLNLIGVLAMLAQWHEIADLIQSAIAQKRIIGLVWVILSIGRELSHGLLQFRKAANPS